MMHNNHFTNRYFYSEKPIAQFKMQLKIRFDPRSDQLVVRW